MNKIKIIFFKTLNKKSKQKINIKNCKEKQLSKANTEEIKSDPLSSTLKAKKV